MSANKQARTACADEATRILEQAGYDEHGRRIGEPESDMSEHEAGRYGDYFGRHIPVDEDEARRSRASDFNDIKQAAERDEARAQAFRAVGDNERADEAERHAYELRQLAAITAREILRTHELFSGVFQCAANHGRWAIAQTHLIDAIKSHDADYALKVACSKALSEIATLVPGGDTGALFDGPWLAELTGIPLRSAQDLIASARALESGVATLLVGTEYGSHKAVRELAEMTPARRREAVTALRQYLTRYLLKAATKKEKTRRSRNISISELRALALIGCNNEEGWGRLIALDTNEGTAWLASEIDKALNHRVLSEATEAMGKQTRTALKSRLRRNAA